MMYDMINLNGQTVKYKLFVEMSCHISSLKSEFIAVVIVTVTPSLSLQIQ